MCGKFGGGLLAADPVESVLGEADEKRVIVSVKTK